MDNRFVHGLRRLIVHDKRVSLAAVIGRLALLYRSSEGLNAVMIGHLPGLVIGVSKFESQAIAKVARLGHAEFGGAGLCFLQQFLGRAEGFNALVVAATVWHRGTV